MPPEPTSGDEGSNNFHMRHWFSVALIGAVSIGIGFYFLQVYIPKHYPLVESTDGGPIATDARHEELGGKIYMSLAPLKSSSHFALNVYTYDTVDRELLPLLSNKNKEYLTSKISPDGTKIAISEFENDGEELTSEMRLLIGNIEMTDVLEVEADEDLIIKRSPSWSSDGTLLAFSGKKEITSAEEFSVENWGVYVYNLNTADSHFVATGTNPIFLPNGNIVILKKDGIYQVNLADKSETRVHEIVEGIASASMRFDVSKDGKRIVWSTPNRSKVRIIEVASWAPFEVSKTDIIETSAFWPVFSPMGEYIAMEVFDWEGEGANAVAVNQHLMIYSLRNNTWESPFDLTSFDQNRMFITDWRSN